MIEDAINSLYGKPVEVNKEGNWTIVSCPNCKNRIVNFHVFFERNTKTFPCFWCNTKLYFPSYVRELFPK